MAVAIVGERRERCFSFERRRFDRRFFRKIFGAAKLKNSRLLCRGIAG